RTLSFDNYFNIGSDVTEIGGPTSSRHSVANVAMRSGVNYKFNKYADEDSWLVSFMDKATTTTTVNGETHVVTTEYEPEPGTTDVKIQRNYVGEPVASTITTLRNAQGVVTSVQGDASDIDGGSASARLTTFSNFEDGIYPTTITNAKGHQRSLEYDKRFGSIS